MKVYKPDEVKITWNGVPLEEGFDQGGTLIITKQLPVEVHEVECEFTITEDDKVSVKSFIEAEKRTICGFVAEPHIKEYYMASPATTDANETVWCHDLAGFLGSWKMKDGGVFFPSPENESVCAIAMDKANAYCRRMNNGED